MQKKEVELPDEFEKGEISNYKSNTSLDKNNIDNIMPMLLEMIDWYKKQKIAKKELVTNESIQIEINLNNPMLSGDIKVHSFRCYENTYMEFLEVCKQYPSIKNQDMISLALLDFIRKYKK